MRNNFLKLAALVFASLVLHVRADTARNPIIHADVPDRAVIRVGDTCHSLDGKSWASIGGELKMSYTLPHFMGYRFGLFNYATKTAGGFVDFDYFRVSDQITASK